MLRRSADRRAARVKSYSLSPLSPVPDAMVAQPNQSNRGIRRACSGAPGRYETAVQIAWYDQLPRLP